ncbi:unnamed protein product [Pneumocystis jirovecii]|uniref:Uncharacterized protein n=1 Tax=Pneumocystis jirovecii TaxID=42068 RepID=L0PE63_PNEJI|nr:unnamed protein product [Pneumocystis jirovecii]
MKDAQSDSRDFSVSSKNSSFLSTVYKTSSYTTVIHFYPSNLLHRSMFSPSSSFVKRAFSVCESEDTNECEFPCKFTSLTTPVSLTSHKSNGNRSSSPIYHTDSFSSLSIRSVELVTPVISTIKTQDMENKLGTHRTELTYPTKLAGSIYNTDGPGTGIRKLTYILYF